MVRAKYGYYVVLLPGGIAGDLSEQQVPSLSSGGAAIGEGELDGVCGGGAKLGVHVVASHGTAHRWRLFSCLA